MKKIKEYFNNKPRLKKTLKVLAVIGVIFSVGFNILIIGVASCHNNNKEAQAQEINIPLVTTPVTKNFYNQSNYVYLGASEFGTYTYFSHFLGVLNNYSYFYNTTYTISDFLNGESIFIRPSNNSAFVFGTMDNGSFTSWDYCSGILFTLDRSNSYKDVMSYKFYWDYDNRYVEVKGTYLYSDTTKSYCVSNIVTYNANNLDNYWNYVYRYDTTSTLKTILPSDFSTFTYEQGFEKGKVFGNEQGYNIGYSDGYSTGVVVGQSGGNNPFDLIKSAFGSIVQVLNIQILPGLTIATLVFTPLIITIIIVIVKMFKG